MLPRHLPARAPINPGRILRARNPPGNSRTGAWAAGRARTRHGGSGHESVRLIERTAGKSRGFAKANRARRRPGARRIPNWSCQQSGRAFAKGLPPRQEIYSSGNSSGIRWKKQPQIFSSRSIHRAATGIGQPIGQGGLGSPVKQPTSVLRQARTSATQRQT